MALFKHVFGGQNMKKDLVSKTVMFVSLHNLHIIQAQRLPKSYITFFREIHLIQCSFALLKLQMLFSSLKNGKSSSVDQLFAEHVKNADKRVTVLLSLLFNACVIHGFLPVGLMETVIVPIIKNARENISSKDNYRPIVLT